MNEDELVAAISKYLTQTDPERATAEGRAMGHELLKAAREDRSQRPGETHSTLLGITRFRMRPRRIAGLSTKGRARVRHLGALRIGLRIAPRNSWWGPPTARPPLRVSCSG